MAKAPKVIIIEDKDEDRREVLLRLAGFCTREDILGEPATYEAALALLQEKAGEVDLVLLDLNLPRNALDARPEKGHGKRLLDHIHNTNLQTNGRIKVIVVSAEELMDGWDADMFKQLYGDTLLGVVQKADLASTLAATLKRFGSDPLRERLYRLNVAVLGEYDNVFNPDCPIRERAKAARALAIRLLRNDIDHFAGRIGESNAYSDDLSRLIKQLESRFAPAANGRHYIDAAAIQSAGGWGAFLWRGTLVNHLYILNNYRNDYEHMEQKPFRGDGKTADSWAIPPQTLASVENGDVLGKVIALIVGEILEWYLPWHEQVYLPWFRGIMGARQGGQR